MLAKLCIAPLDQRRSEIERVLLEIGVQKPHPDLLFIPAGEKLGVEQAKIIKEHFNYKPIQAAGKAVVVESAENMTIEAQNALLKTIEELPENAQLILGAVSENSFLPTVLSRCQIITLKNPGIST